MAVATAVKTAAYTAWPGELVLCDVSAGAFAVTLWPMPADGATIAVLRLPDITRNAVTIATPNGAYFGSVGGLTTISLTPEKTYRELRYSAASNLWHEVSCALSQSGMETRAVTPDDINCSIPRDYATATVSSLTSGTMYLKYATALRDATVSTLASMTVGAVSATGYTLARMGLYTEAANGDITLVASTPSDTTLYLAALTEYSKALSAVYGLVRGSRYAWAWLTLATTTMPTMYGLGVQNNVTTVVSPRRCGQVTGQTDLPGSVVNASIAASTKAIFMRAA